MTPRDYYAPDADDGALAMMDEDAVIDGLNAALDMLAREMEDTHANE